ncbi:hypothetical protein HBB16_18065 [Pseudonocardia sp. MCCB 268]|nr:hypothetical protein [Pseudonocardia cytotoxica]
MDARTALLFDAWFRFDGPVARATVTDWSGGDPPRSVPCGEGRPGSRVTVRVDVTAGARCREHC